MARAARELLGGTYGRRVVIVCGKGNNAGDGLVAGRWLAAWGAHASAVTLLGGELQRGCARGDGGVRRAGSAAPEDLDRELNRADLIIDAIFGVGLSRTPEGEAARAIERLGSASVPVVAVDLPSGVDSDTGALVGGRAVRATRTVTLGGLKPGLMFEPGRSAAGRVEVADIGIPEDLRGGTASALEAADVRALLPHPAGVIEQAAGRDGPACGRLARTSRRGRADRRRLRSRRRRAHGRRRARVGRSHDHRARARGHRHPNAGDRRRHDRPQRRSSCCGRGSASSTSRRSGRACPRTLRPRS